MVTDPPVVIVGAGRTGRGFVAPLLASARVEYVFVDRDPALVKRLHGAEYVVTYFGGKRPPWAAPRVTCHLAGTPAARAALAAAPYVLTSVGADNVPAVAEELVRATRQPWPSVLMCENGVALSEQLLALGYQGEGAQGAVFCTTTTSEDPDSLALQSEDWRTLPFEARCYLSRVLPPAFEPRTDFAILMQRKLYTYNALSAAIAYPGALSGFTWLAEAAHAAQIAELALQVRDVLDQALTHAFGLNLADQQAFSAAALAKFANSEIRDPIERNVRNTPRKLGPTERIMVPLALAKEAGCDTRPLLQVLAFAIAWGLHQSEFTEPTSLPCWAALSADERAAVLAWVGADSASRLSGSGPDGTPGRPCTPRRSPGRSSPS